MEKNSQEENPRKVLENKGKMIKTRAPGIRTWAAAISKKFTEIEDAANIILGAAKYGSEYGDWEASIDAANRLIANFDRISALRDQYYLLMPATDSSGTVVVSNSANLVSNQNYPFMSPEQIQGAMKVNEDINQFFNRYHYRQRVQELMDVFGFTGRMARRKFDAAWEMFLQNPQSLDVSIDALIPLRSTINLTIKELIRCLPTQRKVEGKKKLIEIGIQLAADSVQMDTFIELNDEFRKVKDLLSGSKDNIFNRDHLGDLMRRGTFFLESLLVALDPGKMRVKRSGR